MENSNLYVKNGKAESDDNDEKDYKNTECGVGDCRPSWLQHCSDIRAFTGVVSIAAVFGSMNFSYYTAVITQIEKMYGLSSSMTGFIKNVDNIGYMATVLLVGQFCRYSNKPILFTLSTILTAFAIFLFAVPNFLFPRPKLDFSHHLNGSTNHNTSILDSFDLCQNSNSFMDYEQGDKCHHKSTLLPLNEAALIVFVVSEILQGMAMSPKYTLSVTYMDDSVSDNSPKYFGVLFGMRAVSPILGFLLGAWTNKLYVDLSDPGLNQKDPRWVGAWWLGFIICAGCSFVYGPADPGLNQKDPRWVGAWWLGFIICAGCSFVLAFPLIFFPKNLPKGKNTPVEKKRPKARKADTGIISNLKDLPKAMCRLLMNKMYVCIVIGACFKVYIIGFMTFLPKYLEMYYGLTASMASISTGALITASYFFGPMISGRLMARMRITPTSALKVASIIYLISTIGIIIIMFFECPQTEWVGEINTHESKLVYPCNSNCSCDSFVYTPVCGVDGKNYFSPCFAGCRESYLVGERRVEFTDCQCVEGGAASAGLCDNQCKMVIPYLIVLGITILVSSMAVIPMMTTLMRCVNSKDKALALAFPSFITQLISFPAPMLFGAAVDSTCLFQQSSCTRKGACLLYNPTTLRFRMHGLAVVSKGGALIMYTLALIFSRNWKPEPLDLELDSINVSKQNEKETEEERTNASNTEEKTEMLNKEDRESHIDEKD